MIKNSLRDKDWFFILCSLKNVILVPILFIGLLILQSESHLSWKFRLFLKCNAYFV